MGTNTNLQTNTGIGNLFDRAYNNIYRDAASGNAAASVWGNYAEYSPTNKLANIDTSWATNSRIGSTGYVKYVDTDGTNRIMSVADARAADNAFKVLGTDNIDTSSIKSTISGFGGDSGFVVGPSGRMLKMGSNGIASYATENDVQAAIKNGSFSSSAIDELTESQQAKLFAEQDPPQQQMMRQGPSEGVANFSSLANVGLGIVSYFDTIDTNKKNYNLAEEQLQTSKDEIARVNKFRSNLGNSFA